MKYCSTSSNSQNSAVKIVKKSVSQNVQFTFAEQILGVKSDVQQMYCNHQNGRVALKQEGTHVVYIITN